MQLKKDISGREAGNFVNHSIEVEAGKLSKLPIGGASFRSFLSNRVPRNKF